MGLADLRGRIEEDQFDGRDMEIYDLPPEPMLYPTDPDYIATVYFDGARFSNSEDIDSIMEEYAADYPQHTFHPMVIDLADLRHDRYFASVRAERTFKQQGYVSVLEDRQLRAGKRPDTAFLTAHKEIVHAQAFILAEALEFIGENAMNLAAADAPAGELPRHPMGPLTGHDSKLPKEEIAAALPIWREEFEEENGREDDDPEYAEDYLLEWKAFRTKREAPVPFALVETNGLLLGRSCVNADDTIHMAFPGTPGSFYKGGREAINGGHWTNKSHERIERRLKLELADQRAAGLFDSRHWPGIEADPQVVVSPEMIIAYESQALASLRKIVWRISADESATAVNNGLYADRYAPTLLGGAPRLPINVARLADCLPQETTLTALRANEVREYVTSLGRHGHRGAGAENVTLTLGHRDLLIGAFHGMRYDLRDPLTKPVEIYELAFWLGHLRRYGRATLDCWFWDSVVNHVDRDPLRDIVYSMLSEQAWEILLQAAEELIQPSPDGGVDTSRTISVTYEWSRVQQPWSAVRQGDTVAIEGPLLYFPVHERAHWQEKAEFIRQNGGFVAPLP